MFVVAYNGYETIVTGATTKRLWLNLLWLWVSEWVSEKQKTQIVTKLKNQMLTKLKKTLIQNSTKSNCDKTQQIKLR